MRTTLELLAAYWAVGILMLLVGDCHSAWNAAKVTAAAAVISLLWLPILVFDFFERRYKIWKNSRA